MKSLGRNRRRLGLDTFFGSMLSSYTRASLGPRCEGAFNCFLVQAASFAWILCTVVVPSTCSLLSFGALGWDGTGSLVELKHIPGCLGAPAQGWGGALVLSSASATIQLNLQARTGSSQVNRMSHKYTYCRINAPTYP